MAELVPGRDRARPRRPRRYDLNFTVDAEEADRLELSLDVIEAVLRRPVARRLGRLRPRHPGLPEARRRGDRLDRRRSRAPHGRRMMVRLVKGAYWDTEVKRAQERGLDDYPVFTRKADDRPQLRRLRRAAARRRGRDSTRNSPPTTRSRSPTILERAGDTEGFEFQRLHGMGEALYGRLMRRARRALACRIYAPVGGHRDLLAYLVRRLLENGANSSFVSVAADPDVPVDDAADAPGRPSSASPTRPGTRACRCRATSTARPPQFARRRARPPRPASQALRRRDRGGALGAPSRPRR